MGTGQVLGEYVSLTGMILLAALACWVAFFVMDRLWYHRLLKAAVKHGRKVEDALKASIPCIGLTGRLMTPALCGVCGQVTA